jgi:hypothetical protein
MPQPRNTTLEKVLEPRKIAYRRKLRLTYIVHLNYGNFGGYRKGYLHMVTCLNGDKKLFEIEELKKFLIGKQWRYAK